ncbi:hypothetical protein ACFYO5_18765 [Streptomyces sp. NPDC006259]|uniref:hypothetical protein n=1 Tax=Streptomyces sp. NPDC006259 TaxID=3364740 RepID=UPI00369F8AC9
MSRPGESANPRVEPNVYLPYAETDPPPYEAYRDPAAAHGWENAYDETSELPRVAQASGPQGYDPRARVPGGRADRRRAAARGPRRAVAAVGAVGVVSVAALVAGFAFSGSPDDTGKARPDGTRSAAAETTGGGGASETPSRSPEADTETEREAGAEAETGPAARPGASATDAKATPTSGATASGPPATSPSAGPGTTSAPADAGSTPSTGSGKGNPKGRGKRPR